MESQRRTQQLRRQQSLESEVSSITRSGTKNDFTSSIGRGMNGKDLIKMEK
jgi:hypothetical protein